MSNEKGHNNFTDYSSSLVSNARTLRRNMTRQERKLWYEFLRFYPVKFYRQRPIGNYIDDFYCHAAKLVIELDGSQHYNEEGIDYDQARSAAIEQHGLTVVRFPNNEIDQNFAGVCLRIDSLVANLYQDH